MSASASRASNSARRRRAGLQRGGQPLERGVDPAHPEDARPPQHRLPDAARPDDAERRPAERAPEQEVEVPTPEVTPPDKGVGLDDPPREGEQQRPGQIGRVLGEHAGGVRDRDATPAGGP